MNQIVTLDVGGSIYRASRTTLCSQEGYFSAMLGEEGEWKESLDLSTPIFIDRDPLVFPGILSYLRSHKAVFLGREDDTYLHLLLIEADFYMYSLLTKAILHELERRKVEEETKQASAIANTNNTTYKIVSEAEASLWFDRGWTFISQYYGNESSGCPLGPSYCVATYEHRGTPRCSVCKESMHYERFLKHTVLFKPCMFVLSKKFQAASRSSSISAPLPPIPSSVGGILADDALANIISEANLALGGDGLAFDQSFG